MVVPGTKPDCASMGGRLRAAREHAGLNQVQFAEAVGFSRRQIIAWERCENQPPAAVLARLREVCGVSPEWVLSGPGPVPLEYVTPDDLCRVTRVRGMLVESAQELGIVLPAEAASELATLVVAEPAEDEVAAFDRVLRIMRALPR